MSERAWSPVEGYLMTLDRSLRGHPRDKSLLLQELRDGLEDAAVAHNAAGVPEPQAAEQALGEFGSVQELVSACQPELSLRQVRRTARAVTVTVPALIVFWHLLFGDRLASLPRGAVLLGEHLAGTGAATAALAALTLLVIGPLSRWLPTPRRLPMLVSVIASLSAVTMAVGPVAMAAAAPAAGMWFSILLGVIVAAVPLGTIVMAAWLCRSCAATTSARPEEALITPSR